MAQYEWIGSQPVQTDNVEYEWIAALPWICYDATVYVEPAVRTRTSEIEILITLLSTISALDRELDSEIEPEITLVSEIKPDE